MNSLAAEVSLNCQNQYKLYIILAVHLCSPEISLPTAVQKSDMQSVETWARILK